MSRLRQIWNTAFGCLSDHDYNREVHIPRCFLGILGIWSEPEPMSRLKCALSATLLTFFNFLPRFLGLFNIANDRLFFYHLGSVAYRLYIIVVILLLHFNFKIRRSIVEEMGDNWRTTQALEDKKVMRRYADYSRKISWIIIAAFAATFVITWLSLLLGLATGQMELHAALSALSFQSQPLVDALGIIFVTIASFISLLPAMGTETFFAVCVCHTCGQLALLKNRIAAYEGVTRHQFEQDTPGMCSCLKCIVDSHVKICDFVATIDNHFHVVLFFRLVAGVVGVVCGGFEVSKAIVKGEYRDLMTFILFTFIIFFTICTNCSLAEMCQQASYALGDAAYSTDWMTKHPRDRRNLMLIINYSRGPLKFTAGKYFVSSRHHFKEWCLTSASYISTLVTMKLNK